MKNHNFCYNYSFLSDWFRANPQIRRYGVLGELGMTDYATLQNWINGKTMMPMTNMMRFCNLYNVPLTAFFYDECAEGESVFAPLHADAMIEPAGGWPDSNRKAGIKVCDPRTEKHTNSKLPAYCKEAVRKGKVTETEAEAAEVTTEERGKYLDIIKNLSDRLLELSKENHEMKEQIARSKRMTYTMAAEEGED